MNVRTLYLGGAREQGEISYPAEVVEKVKGSSHSLVL